MDAYKLLDRVWDARSVCATCEYRYKEIDYGECWGSSFTSVSDRCRVIERDMDPMNCPGIEARQFG